MNKPAGTSRVVDIVKLFGVLQGLYGRLLLVITAKVDALRRADVAVLHALTEEERELTQRLQERHGLRRQLTALSGRELGISGAAAKTLTVSQLASRAPAEQAQSLTAAAGSLRDAVGRVAQANRAFALSTRELIGHLHWAFRAVRPRLDSDDDYGGGRAQAWARPAQLIDAVG